jgi:beta-lactamase class D
MTNSTVWFYQNLASTITAPGERKWLALLKYGNQEMGPDEDLKKFWLTGQLRITAIQEVLFLERLLKGTLPTSTKNQARVRQMMLQAQPFGERGWPLHAKSGAVLPIDSGGELKSGPEAVGLVKGLDLIGWYVGWVDRPAAEGGPIVFALNLDLSVPEAMAKRERLARLMIAME